MKFEPQDAQRPGVSHLAVRLDGAKRKLAGSAGTHDELADACPARLAERYARASLPVTEGTGLGLCVGRALARANGGDLVLGDSAVGRGR